MGINFIRPNAWKCPHCSWMEVAHPDYGWQKHNSHAVEVHITTLCPNKKLCPNKNSESNNG